VRLSRPSLVLAFAFTVMADPVSSVAYAIEAALRSLDGDLASLVPTMTAIIAIIGVISATCHELIGRFPGGGGPEGIARAFGVGWAFVSLGALLVDFTLTVAVSCAAGATHGGRLCDGDFIETARDDACHRTGSTWLRTERS
jgi:hypothetical protein